MTINYEMKKIEMTKAESKEAGNPTSAKFEELMKNYDAVLTPVCSKTAYGEYNIKDAFGKVFEESVFTAVANLTGTPALVSGGVQLMGKHFSESTLLSLAGAVEKEVK